MTIKLVALDLDDTLLDSRLQVAPECQEAILQVREMGVQVTLATGRMFRSALPYAQQLDINVPLITYQGALVKNSGSGETLYYRPLPGEYTLPLLERVREVGYHCQLYLDDELYMEKLTAEGKQYASVAGVKPVIVDSLDGVLKKETTKMVIIHFDLQALDELEKRLRDEFSHLYITRSKPAYLEVLHPEATKGKALAAVAEYFGVKQDEVMAVGDSYNDLKMIRWAGLGVAMANAPSAVRKEADYVTCSNDENGVAEALGRWVLTEREGS